MSGTDREMKTSLIGVDIQGKKPTNGPGLVYSCQEPMFPTVTTTLS